MLITEQNVHTIFSLVKIISDINGINYLQIAPDHDNHDDGSFGIKIEKKKKTNLKMF